jgi:hypothetical protein
MADGGDEELNDNHRARRLEMSNMVLKSTMTIDQIYGHIHGLFEHITAGAYRYTSIVISRVHSGFGGSDRCPEQGNKEKYDYGGSSCALT